MKRVSKTNLLTLDEISCVLRYVPSTGLFYWRINRGRGGNGAKAGDIAGCIGNHGYVQINTRLGQVLAHRLAWLFTHGAMPDGEVDHINGDRTDNRIENLRLATRAENARNVRRHSDNECGLKGAHKVWRKFRAEIMRDGKKTHLGYFETAEEAHQAYCEAADKHHGRFARAG